VFVPPAPQACRSASHAWTLVPIAGRASFAGRRRRRRRARPPAAVQAIFSSTAVRRRRSPKDVRRDACILAKGDRAFLDDGRDGVGGVIVGEVDGGAVGEDAGDGVLGLLVGVAAAAGDGDVHRPAPALSLTVR